MYRLRFEKDGYTIFIAHRGKDGIDIAVKEQPDLILLDVVMPEMDGYQTLQKMKANPKIKKLRVIFLSNLGQHDQVEAGMKMGAEGYIIKSSLTPSSLVAEVEKILKVDPKEKPNGTAVPKTQPIKAENVDKPLCQGLKILLIEDNPVIIDMYRIRLEKEGAEVTVAKNGAWGIKQAGNGEYDVILMDMVMPAINGLQAIKDLKKSRETANIPIIVFSNSAQEEDMEEAVSAGAEKYFVKSAITPASIVQEVKKFCKNK